MIKPLPGLLLLILHLSFSAFGMEKRPYEPHTDSLALNTAREKEFSLVENRVSASFLEHLDEKFPETETPGQFSGSHYTTPEFSWENIHKDYPVSSVVSDHRGMARASFTEIEQSGLWVDNFSNEDIVALPVGVKHSSGNIEYAIGIVKAEIHPEHTTLSVFARVTLQQTDGQGKSIELFFGANNVKLSHRGGIIGDARLVLLGDMPIPFNGGNWLVQLNGGFDYRNGNTA